MEQPPKKLAEALKEFRLPPAKEEKAIHDSITPVVIEERQLGVSSEARDDFARLYDTEIKRLGYCPLDKIQHFSKAVKDNGPRQCRVKLESFQHFLVHHQIHLMLTADSRVQKQTNAQALELVYPTSEKTMRAALGPEERKRMLVDRMKRRELREG